MSLATNAIQDDYEGHNKVRLKSRVYYERENIVAQQKGSIYSFPGNLGNQFAGGSSDDLAIPPSEGSLSF